MDWNDCKDVQRNQLPGQKPGNLRRLQLLDCKDQGNDVVPKNCWGQQLKSVVCYGHWWCCGFSSIDKENDTKNFLESQCY